MRQTPMTPGGDARTTADLAQRESLLPGPEPTPSTPPSPAPQERRLSGLRVAVTGASGFCGGEVARVAAAAGADVVCLGRRAGPVGRHVRWDAASQAPDLAGADVVMHLAAAVGDPGTRPGAAAEFGAVNVTGAQRLLTAARDRPVVWVSSASVYDPHRDRGLVREDHPVGGQLNAYGQTKAAGERLALSAGAVVLRPHAVYGPGDPHLLPRLRRHVRAGVLALPGGDVQTSLTSVRNLADACLASLCWPAGAYNVADATAYSRDKAITGLFAAMGQPVKIAHAPLRVATMAATVAEWHGQIRGIAEPLLSRYAVNQLAHDMVLDLSKAAAQGWSPRWSLADYLRWLSGSTRN
jgi:nucleoside-diphosphate-sugar epimerase